MTYFWLEKSLHRDFYVIKESLGGTAIDLRAKSTNNMYWSASTAFLDTTRSTTMGGRSLLKAFTENIGACIDQQLSKCKEGYEIKAFIWHQGESDRKTAEIYYDNMKAVIDYVRAYVVKKTGKKRYDTLPVILGGISHRGRGYSQGVEQAQIKLTQTVKNVYFVRCPMLRCAATTYTSTRRVLSFSARRSITSSSIWDWPERMPGVRHSICRRVLKARP